MFKVIYNKISDLNYWIVRKILVNLIYYKFKQPFLYSILKYLSPTAFFDKVDDNETLTDCSTDKNLSSALFKALESRSIETLKKLIAAGADVNRVNNNLMTPIAFLLNKIPLETNTIAAVKANLLNLNDLSILILGQCSIVNELTKMLDILIEAGAKANTSDILGYTPLHKIIECTAVENIYLAKWRALYPNEIFNKHLTSFLLEIFDKLIKAGADINAKTMLSNDTPLHIAVESNSIEFVKKLIEAGADINAVNERLMSVYEVDPLRHMLEGLSITHDDTPMSLAIKYNHGEIVKYLNQCGADIGKNIGQLFKSENLHWLEYFINEVKNGNNKYLYRLLKYSVMSVASTKYIEQLLPYANNELELIDIAKNLCVPSTLIRPQNDFHKLNLLLECHVDLFRQDDSNKLFLHNIRTESIPVFYYTTNTKILLAVLKHMFTSLYILLPIEQLRVNLNELTTQNILGIFDHQPDNVSQAITTKSYNDLEDMERRLLVVLIKRFVPIKLCVTTFLPNLTVLQAKNCIITYAMTFQLVHKNSQKCLFEQLPAEINNIIFSHLTLARSPSTFSNMVTSFNVHSNISNIYNQLIKYISIDKIYFNHFVEDILIALCELDPSIAIHGVTQNSPSYSNQ